MRSLLLLLCLIPVASFAQHLRVNPQGATVEVTLTISPASGYCPYTAQATWSATNASVCQKSGYWTGTGVLASGSEQIEVNSATAAFTLTCSANTDYRDLTWVNPTQNTDGSAVNLQGNKVYHYSSSTGIETSTPIVIAPAATSYRVTGLPAGTRYFGVKATGKQTNNIAGIDSAMSNLASVTVNLPSGTKTTTVGCTTPPPPKPPTGVNAQ